MPEEQVKKPGEYVPESGIYRCDGKSGGCPHSVNVEGHRLPPLPTDCRGGGWVLETSGHQANSGS